MVGDPSQDAGHWPLVVTFGRSRHQASLPLATEGQIVTPAIENCIESPWLGSKLGLGSVINKCNPVYATLTLHDYVHVTPEP